MALRKGPSSSKALRYRRRDSVEGLRALGILEFKVRRAGCSCACLGLASFLLQEIAMLFSDLEQVQFSECTKLGPQVQKPYTHHPQRRNQADAASDALIIRNSKIPLEYWQRFHMITIHEKHKQFRWTRYSCRLRPEADYTASVWAYHTRRSAAQHDSVEERYVELTAILKKLL